MKQVQTNNSELTVKLELRKKVFEKFSSLNILNCFAGDDIIYKSLKKEIKFESVLNIEKKHSNAISIKGDNIKVLKNIDLTEFNIIDLDAYGSPSPQLDIIFKKGFKGIIIFTFIVTGMGQINKNILLQYGYTENMIKKCPTLFTKNPFEKFKNYLAKNGVNKIYYYNINKTSNKYYGYFEI